MEARRDASGLLRHLLGPCEAAARKNRGYPESRDSKPRDARQIRWRRERGLSRLGADDGELGGSDEQSRPRP